MPKLGWLLLTLAVAVFIGWCCAIGKIVWTVASRSC